MNRASSLINGRLVLVLTPWEEDLCIQNGSGFV